MSKIDHYMMLENMYLAAPCNAYYKPEINIEEGKSTVKIEITPKLYHAAGAAHGSVYFKAADDAAFFAVNSLVEEVFVLTTNLNVYLTRPIQEGMIIAKGRVIFSSQNLWHAEAILKNDEGTEIGRAMASFARSRISLSDDLGYTL